MTFSFPCEQPSTGAALAFAGMLQGKLPTLATERLLLRAPKVEDFETYADVLCSDRGRFMGGPMSREDAWADFSRVTANWLLHGHGAWTIGYHARVAGFVLLTIEPGDREPELGFILADWAEGQNVGFEAGMAAQAHAFDTLGWTTLVSYIDPGNARSARLARRLGAVRDGEIDEDGAITHVYRYHPERG